MKILIIYGSVGGNTELAADQAALCLKLKGHSVKIQRAELSRPADLKMCDALIFASPTYGHGILQSDMAKFTGQLTPACLKNKPCAVIGLGDPKYDAYYHIESADILELAVKNLGGKLIVPPLRISRSPVLFLDNLISKWAGMFSSAFAGEGKRSNS